MDSTSVLNFFQEITRIPRESGHEQPITEYLQQFAAKRGLACKTDKTGNVLITKPASPGKEKVPTLVLQAHQDMVCEKTANFDFDFRTQPIPYVIEDGWMIAKNTTLGADDGIGIAACRCWTAHSLWVNWNACSPSRKKPVWTEPSAWKKVSLKGRP